MKKQVLAILLATLLILTTFAACGKKYLVYTDADGITHPVLTDAEGNTMLNEYGQIVVGVTEKNGKLVTDANGEYETRAILFPSSIANGNVFETPHFKMTVPEKQWYFEDTTLYKKDSECYASIDSFENRTLQQSIETEKKILQQLEEEMGEQIRYEIQDFSLSVGVTVHSILFDMLDENGALIEVRQAYYFEVKDTLYKFLFVAPAAEADAVDFADMLNMIKFR